MNISKIVQEWVSSFLMSFAAALFITIFIFQPVRVEGSSMEPTLHNCDYIFLSKLSHTMSRIPDYGEIVVIDSRTYRNRSVADDLSEPLINMVRLLRGSEANEYNWVKRIIGRPGDVLEFKDGVVYRNGVLLDEPYIKENMKYNSTKQVLVPENHVFVMGDNRNYSSDSRFIGSIPVGHVLGTKL